MTIVTKTPWKGGKPADAAEAPSVLNEITTISTKMASDIVDVAGFLDVVGEQADKQSAEMSGLRQRVDDIVDANRAVQDSIAIVTEASENNLTALNDSMEVFHSSSESSKQMANWVQSVENRIGAVVETLKNVERLNEEISSIARQVNILAINAKIEAVRAGTHGRGFAVVAEAINDLSRNTSDAAEAVSEGVESLAKNFSELRQEAAGIQGVAAKVIDEVSHTNDKMSDMAHQLQSTVSTTVSMRQQADRISNAVESFGPVFDTIAGYAEETGKGVLKSRDRIHALVDDSETVVRQSILGGGASDDKQFIDYVTETAAAIGREFEQAVRHGQISEVELFDYTYTPIPNTDPQQVLARFTRFTDGVLPRLQEPALQLDPRVVFCAAVDVNGYLPTHNMKFSHPQGADPVWNMANSRNRRVFDDRVGLKAGQSTEPFLMQVYRRDMGGGNFVMMKDLSAPIHVNGRHWGGLRLAYKI